MKCPYCNEEMMKGFVYGDRYTLKWSEHEDLFLGAWVIEGTRLGTGGAFTTRPRVEATMCQSCKKIVIDME